MMILGFTQEELERVYKLYVHTNKAEPDDLFQLRMYWRKNAPYTVEDAMRITAQFSEADHAVTETTEFWNMVQRFIAKIG